jgi:hypothetical protein
MIWNAAVYCALVAQDTVMVSLRCTLVYVDLFDSWDTPVHAAPLERATMPEG